jgi:hypothetical protein
MIPGTIGLPNGELFEAIRVIGPAPHDTEEGKLAPELVKKPSPEVTLGQVIEQSEEGPPV